MNNSQPVVYKYNKIVIQKFQFGENHAQNRDDTTGVIIMDRDELRNFLKTLGVKENLWVDLSGASLRDIDFQYTDLYSANFQGADLKGANLQHTELQNANFQGANLWGANLEHANLGEANFREADLQHTNLALTNLSADLRGADLWGANLSGAKIFSEQVQEIILAQGIEISDEE